MSRLWRAYLHLLNTHPIKVQGITTGALICVGDVLAQQFVEKKGLHGHDYARTIRQGIFGVVFVGPVMISWYRVLDRLYPGTGKLVPLYKVATDQVIFAPFIITCFMSFVAFGRGKTATEVKDQLSADFIPTLLTAYKIYPALQIFNFYITPLNLRPVVVNVVSIFWNTYLSWKSNNPTIQEVAVTKDTT